MATGRKTNLAALAGALASLLGLTPSHAQNREPLLPETPPEQISPHVYIVRGNPVIGIIAGEMGTLVVDTGIGPRNGALVARDAAQLAKGRKLYLTTTHIHPEHASGEGGFPAGTILIRPKAQQAELEADHDHWLNEFRRRPPPRPELLAGVVYRKPDATFDKTYNVDLGGVHVQLIYSGPAHTVGDEEIWVKEDGVLFTGDVVQNRAVPEIKVDGLTPRDWLRTLEALRRVHPTIVVPDHTPPGGYGLMTEEQEFLSTLESSARALRAAGVSAEDASAQITAQMRASHAGWSIRDNGLRDLVARAYAESP